MMDVNKLLLSILLLTVTGIESARILAYFPSPSISHQVAFRPLILELAKRGHEVTVVTTDPAFPAGKAPANLTEIDVHDVSYNLWGTSINQFNNLRNDLVLQTKLVFSGMPYLLDHQLESPQVKNILKSKHRKYFDLLLLEAWSRPLLGLANIFDAPVIAISSFGAIPYQYDLLGAPMHPLLYPTPGMERSYNLTLVEKGIELVKYVDMEYFFKSSEDHDLKYVGKHFNITSFNSVRHKIKMMFLNEHPIWANNRPVPPSIIYIGGIHQTENKELPQELKAYLDSTKHGVIYISFGTNVLPSLLPPEKIKIMTKVLSSLPYNILWKWDTDVLPGQSDNIKIAKWFPQSDLLKHPKIKLFITQGGLQSTDEAIDAAVPVIGIPIVSDQWYNVEKYVQQKIGHQLYLSTLTEEKFKESIETVIGDKSYKENILKLRTIMRDCPIKPLDHAVWWTEHVIKYGGDHLQSPAANVSWAEYYEVKLLFVFLGILASVLTLLVLVAKKIITIIFRANGLLPKLKSL